MQKNDNTYLVIMAGGIGSRFWPFSRQYYPKQFQDILGTGKSLLQQTIKRFEPICKPENMYIVTSERYISLIKEQLPHFSDEQILPEPCLRNTAPCIAYASYKIKSQNSDANIIVSPADHVILDSYAFLESIQIALDAVNQTSKIVTLGIEPTRPDTGYGYIQIDENQGDLESQAAKKVAQFREKPSLDKAKEYLQSGNYLWNAGIFIWNVSTITEAFEEHMPHLSKEFEHIKEHFYTEKEGKTIEEKYPTLESISIDYGIMEKAQNVYVVPSDCGWSDLGTWKSLYEQAPKDENQNVITGNVMAYDTKNSIIKTPQNRLVLVQGLDNFIVADYDDVLLICHKDQEQRIKSFLAEVKESQDERFV